MDDPVAFYASLAAHYDLMTRFGQRRDRERSWIKAFVRKYGVRTAVDAACGTGVHALLLAECGVSVTGLDISAELLDRARANAARCAADVCWVHAAMQQASAVCAAGQDAVLCLGNALPHLLGEEALDQALVALAAVLRPGGRLVLQLLNYARILAARERIVGVRRQGRVEFVRFYDFDEPFVRFNVLRIEASGDGSKLEYQLNSTRLRAYRLPELRHALGHCGFGDVTAYGNAAGNPFDAAASPELFLHAVRL